MTKLSEVAVSYLGIRVERAHQMLPYRSFSQIMLNHLWEIEHLFQGVSIICSGIDGGYRPNTILVLPGLLHLQTSQNGQTESCGTIDDLTASESKF